MNFVNKWTGLAALILSAGIVSCSSDKEDPINPADPTDPSDPSVLAPEDYPVTFIAEIGPYSRASVDNIWAGDESIAVQMSSSIDQQGTTETAMYQIGADANLTSETPFYWTRDDETIKVRAWYLGDGTTSTDIPDTWQVPADQSSGLQKGDLLYAAGELAFKGNHTLSFYHQTAKVTVNVKSTGNAASSIGISSLTLGDANLALSGAISFPDDMTSRVTWTPGNSSSTITPMTLTPENGYSAKAAAMLIPQDITGKAWLKITLTDGTALTYVRDEATQLLGGHEYVLEATINYDRKTLDVTMTVNSSWIDGGSNNVDSSEVDVYGEAKIGDYFYSDGSWSDGGFLGFNTEGNGSIKWASPKPAPTSTNPVTGRTRRVIGIVFSTDISRMGAAEKEALRAMGADPHGLVISTKTFTSQWDLLKHDETEIGLASIASSNATELYELLNADISGYNVAQTILTKRAADVSVGNYPMISYATYSFADEIGGPENGAKTTGWYVPAAGQMFDMLRNFTGLEFTDKPEYFYYRTYEGQVIGINWQRDKYLSFFEKYPEKLVDLLNFTMSEVNAADKEDFPISSNYFTSSFANSESMFVMPILQKYVSCEHLWKDNLQPVRCVLAF